MQEDSTDSSLTINLRTIVKRMDLSPEVAIQEEAEEELCLVEDHQEEDLQEEDYLAVVEVDHPEVAEEELPCEVAEEELPCGVEEEDLAGAAAEEAVEGCEEATEAEAEVAGEEAEVAEADVEATE